MNTKQTLAAILTSAVASAGFAATVASSNFTTGAEGWKTENGSQNFQWMAAGGESGGFIEATDINAQALWFFSAPSTYLGNQLAAYGGTLSYALTSGPISPPIPGAYADVQLLGNNGVLLAFGGLGNPTSNWSDFSVSLVANGSWKIGSTSGAAATFADMIGVLSDLKAMRIRGDYKTAVETTGLDSVVLATAPVPEPANAAMLLLGLAAVCQFSVRRSSRNTRT